MSILQLKKVSLIGLTQQKMQLLDELQELSLLHVVPLRKTQRNRDQQEEAANPELLKRSLQYLLSCPNKRRQVTREKNFNLNQVLQAVEHNRRERLALQEKRDFLEKRIEDLEPWGDFILPDPQELNHQKLWFYLLPNYRTRELEELTLPWMVVHRDNRHTYLVVLAEEEPEANRLPVPRTHTGDQPLSQLQEDLEETLVALEATEANREALTRWIYRLQLNIANTDNLALLQEVADQTLDYDEIFALQGWIAERNLEQLRHFCQEQGLVLLEEDASAEEIPPTLLDNPEQLQGGQEVVNFFQTPNYHSWDPSRVVFFSFVSFFAIIMSDVGYSLLLGAILLWKWKALGKTLTHRRLRTLGVALTGAGVLWGLLVGSYFGAPPPLPWLAHLKVLDLNDFDAMMTLSIVIGAAHLLLANLIMAWVRRHSLQSWASLGWALAVVAALTGWLQGFALGHWLALGLGLAAVLLFSAPGREWRWGNLISGLLALTNITKIFGDVLSYLRLFALGLASASLAITFNQLAADVVAAMPGLGLLLQMLILLVGHLLNFVLTVVSGVIHGLRLNLIEFYNWSLADEGYPFQPFAKQEVKPWTT
ncbi:V-type ATP synthase subunit I [Marinospirillum perlucidum]|uniref:V-type ATP synthase subunit I n=1 Tax=Marinospirillum perlucidum TaxID=1982602 RepID=UPI000DF3D29E|nr:V-type ATP synthase subunit I [Marinospirillum perlucidum]